MNIQEEIKALEMRLSELRELEKNTFSQKIKLIGYDFSDHNLATQLGLPEKLEALVVIVDLCDQCNSKFEKDNEYNNFSLTYYEGSIEVSHNTAVFTIAKFNNSKSAQLAIEKINASPELTKHAKVFLGVQE